MTNRHSTDTVESVHFALSHATGMANRDPFCYRTDGTGGRYSPLTAIESGPQCGTFVLYKVPGC